MITDFKDIKDEKDRILYVEFRNILDNFFINKIEEHKEKDHKYNECGAIGVIDILESAFPERLKQECKENNLPEIEIIQGWIEDNESNFVMYLMSLVVLNKEYNKRKH